MIIGSTERNSKIVVGTYNMSFASEWDIVPSYASERYFLQSTKDIYDKRNGTYTKEYFKNAHKQLKDFISSKKPIVIGLQEMNMFNDLYNSQLIYENFNKEKIDNLGGNFIGSPEDNPKLLGYGLVGEYKDKKGIPIKGVIPIRNSFLNSQITRYRMYTGMVLANNAAVSIIINTDITGRVLGDDGNELTSFEIFEYIGEGITHEKIIPNLYIKSVTDILNEDNTTFTRKVRFDTDKNPNWPKDEETYGPLPIGSQNLKVIDHVGGRPIFMLYTEKGFLIVCVHGSQAFKLAEPSYIDPITKKKGSAQLFNDDMIAQNKTYVEEQIKLFLNGREPKYIFIMGDLNDRYDGITEYKIGEKTVTYTGDSPFSCCYNWDSSGTEETSVFIPSGTNEQNPDEISNKFKRGNNKPDKDNVTDGLNDLDTNKRSNVKNYLYKGDKVFGSIPNGEFGTLQMYAYNPDERSTKSDHELVYLEINAPISTLLEKETTVSGGNKKRRMNKTKKRRGKTHKKRGGKSKKK